MTGADVVREARTWLGVRYEHQGRLKSCGVDCIGLPLGVAKALGLVPESLEITGYGRDPDGVTIKRLCDEHMTPIAISDVQIGDVVVQRLPKRALAQHFGIITDYLHGGFGMIHASANSNGKGEVVEHHLGNSIARRILLAYRLPGIL